MLKLILVRHGETQGNKLKRYIGKRTDEPLCPEAGNMLAQLAYPEVQAVYASPMIRCTQTAGILFPGKKLNIIDELAECDFGEFENKNYQELDGNEHYQSWIDSGGLLPFPGGESREEFKRRNVTGFQKAVNGCLRNGISLAALVVHGGTIMNVMEEYADEDRSFYDWHVQNGKGYEVEIDPELWKKGREILACDPGVIKIHIRIMQMENQLWIRACLKNPLIERTRQFV
ncbi:MAG: histidine phosphatase family protein [Ruminococcus sp.]